MVECLPWKQFSLWLTHCASLLGCNWTTEHKGEPTIIFPWKWGRKLLERNIFQSPLKKTFILWSLKNLTVAISRCGIWSSHVLAWVCVSSSLHSERWERWLLSFNILGSLKQQTKLSSTGCLRTWGREFIHVSPIVFPLCAWLGT